MGAAAERTRRTGDRRRGVPDEGAARPDRRPRAARTGGRQHPGPGRAPEPRRVPGAGRRRGGDSRRRGVARPRLVQGHRRRIVARGHDPLARRADAPLLHRSRERDHEGRVELVDGRRDLLRHGHGAGGAGAGGGVYAEGGRRPQRRGAAARRRADRRRQARQRLRRPAADVDLRADRRGRPHALPRVRVDSRPPRRQLRSPELPRHPAARHRLGRQARQRRRADEARRARRRAALRRGRADTSRPRRGHDRGASRLHPVAGRRRAADQQGDEHRLGREGAAVGRGNAGIPERPARAEHDGLEGHRLAQADDGRRAIPSTPSRS